MIPRLFYGWWIVVAAILLQCTFLSTSQVVVGVFLRPMVEELGWQVWQFTLGSSLSVMAAALSGVAVGRIVDRHGPRLPVFIGALVTSLCLYGLGRQSNLWLFWALHLCAGLMGWTLFGPLVVNTTLNKWFVRWRGWALAIGSTGISLAGLVAPLTMTMVVDAVGWRNGYFVLGLFVLAVVVPGAFLMRSTPEAYGLSPDGEAAPGRARQIHRPLEPTYSGLQAVRTQGFWLLLFGYSLNQAALSSVLVHAIPFATDASFARSTAALALAINGLGNLISKAVWGYGLQHFPPRRLAVTAFSLGAAGVGLMLLAASFGEPILLFVGFFCYGFGFGGTIPISEYLWVSYFGRTHIGAIRGISQPLTIIGPTIGPVLVSLWYDRSGRYGPAFFAIIVTYLVGALLVWLSHAPLTPNALGDRPPVARPKGKGIEPA